MKPITPAKITKIAEVMRSLGIAKLRTPEIELEMFPEPPDVSSFDAGGEIEIPYLDVNKEY